MLFTQKPLQQGQDLCFAFSVCHLCSFVLSSSYLLSLILLLSLSHSVYMLSPPLVLISTSCFTLFTHPQLLFFTFSVFNVSISVITDAYDYLYSVVFFPSHSRCILIPPYPSLSALFFFFPSNNSLFTHHTKTSLYQPTNPLIHTKRQLYILIHPCVVPFLHLHLQFQLISCPVCINHILSCKREKTDKIIQMPYGYH